MKSGNLKTLSFAFFLLFVLAVSCKENSEVFENLDESTLNIEKISVGKDQKLQSLLENLYSPNGRSQILFQGSQTTVDLDSALKVEIPERSTTKYSLILNTEGSGDFSFSNLVLIDRDGESEYLILEYFPDDEWLLTQLDGIDWSVFTGKVEGYTIDGELLHSNYLDNGVIVAENSQAGRIMDMYECEGDVSCHWNSHLEHYYCTYDISCSAGGSGGGTSGGSTSGGTSSGGSTGGGTTGGGDGYPSGGGGGSGSTGSNPTDSEDNYDPIGILPNNPVTVEQQLSLILSVDPFALMDIDCDQIEKWQELAQDEASNDIVNKIANPSRSKR